MTDNIFKNKLFNTGAWCWFQSPNAVQFNDRIYLGWVKKNGDVVISSYNKELNKTSLRVLHPKLQIDDHAAPSILILPNGKIIAFYSAHMGDNLYYRISKNSEDISSWSKEMSIGTNVTVNKADQKHWGWNYTYSNPVQLSSENNKIYLFWRGANGKPSFSTSTDSASSWSGESTLFYVPKESPYVKICSNGTDKIYFTFTDGHPQKVRNNNVYFAYYQNGSFYKADGTFIKGIEALPLVPSDVDMVYDSFKNGSGAWIWDIAVDKFGFPVIVYANFRTLGDHRYRYARWNGKRWDDNEITPAGGSVDKINEPYYSGGITIDHENPAKVFLSREVKGTHEIEEWITEDGGFSWDSKAITSRSKNKNMRPIVPRNHDSKNVELFWMNGKYSSYTEYDTKLMVRFSAKF
jgi:hypothetical protein